MTIKSLGTRDNKIQFVKSQINLFMRDAWLLAEGPQFQPVAINRHIASLRRSNGLVDEFRGILEPLSAMPSFDEQPLACLTFSGELDDEDAFLDIEIFDSEQVSVMFFLQKYIDIDTTTFSSKILMEENWRNVFCYGFSG